MEATLSDITKVENEAIAEFEGLVAAKEKEIAAATEAIEAKTERAGEVAVQIVNLKNTLPSPSLLQMSRRSGDVRKEALALVQKLKRDPKEPQLSLITMALQGKKAGFAKVIKLIDEMVVKLGVEQEDDDAQKKWCEEEFDTTEDQSKDTSRLIKGLTAKIGETEEAIKTVTAEIAELKKGIEELDEAVTDATKQRKDEHKEFVQTAAENNAALQLLEVAKNRLNKFYNPTLYKEPERRELTEEERIYVNSGGADPRDAEEAAVAGTGIAGTGVTVFAQVAAKL